MIFSYDPRAIHRFLFSDFMSLGILYGSRMSYGVMGLWSIFWILCSFGQMSFRPNVRFSMFFGYLSSRRSVFGQMSIGHMSIMSFVFRPYVHSAKGLSFICLFVHVSYGHMSVRPFVFRPSVLSPGWAPKVRGSCHSWWTYASPMTPEVTLFA